MRYLLLAIALLSSAAHAGSPTSVSSDDLQHAHSLGATYRQCLQDTLGERYTDAGDPMQMARAIESSCEPQLGVVQRFLAARGYAQATVRDVIVDIKARADGATIAAMHRLPPYRF
jgi:hypothetical protein